MAKIDLSKFVRQLLSCPADELNRLGKIIAYIEFSRRSKEEDEGDSPNLGENEILISSAEKRKRGGGCIERKYINGCGPYVYFRFWEDGKRRTIYLGKEAAT